MEKQLRKKQNMLGISGIAVIVFGIWSIAKLVINALYMPERISKFFNASEGGVSDPVEDTIVFVAVLIIVAIDLGLRLLVGLSARAESKGKKKSIFYLIVAIILVLSSVFSIIVTFQSFFADSIFDTIIAIFLDLTSILALCDVITSSFGIRSLKKKIAQGT